MNTRAGSGNVLAYSLREGLFLNQHEIIIIPSRLVCVLFVLFYKDYDGGLACSPPPPLNLFIPFYYLLSLVHVA